MIKLDIGSGGKSTDSTFLGVDAFTEADINALMWDLPYKDGEVDVIYSSNALEHISKFNIIPTLWEWKRVLKIGGKLEIIVPDLVWACMWWLSHQNTDWSMDILYGHQSHEGEFHRTGFTPEIMESYLDVCGGFKLVKVGYYGSSLESTLTFPESIAQRMIDFQILRIDEPSVSQQVEETDSKSV